MSLKKKKDECGSNCEKINGFIAHPALKKFKNF